MIALPASSIPVGAPLIDAILLVGVALVVRRASKRWTEKVESDVPPAPSASVWWMVCVESFLMSAWCVIGVLILWTLVRALSALPGLGHG